MQLCPHAAASSLSLSYVPQKQRISTLGLTPGKKEEKHRESLSSISSQEKKPPTVAVSLVGATLSQGSLWCSQIPLNTHWEEIHCYLKRGICTRATGKTDRDVLQNPRHGKGNKISKHKHRKTVTPFGCIMFLAGRRRALGSLGGFKTDRRLQSSRVRLCRCGGTPAPHLPFPRTLPALRGAPAALPPRRAAGGAPSAPTSPPLPVPHLRTECRQTPVPARLGTYRLDPAGTTGPSRPRRGSCMRAIAPLAHTNAVKKIITA